jgi:hypothetical protein
MSSSLEAKIVVLGAQGLTILFRLFLLLRFV